MFRVAKPFFAVENGFQIPLTYIRSAFKMISIINCDEGQVVMNKMADLKLSRLLCDAKGLNYIEALIVYAAAPTIKGVKPAALTRFTAIGRNTLHLWNTFGGVKSEKADLIRRRQLELQQINA